MAKPTKLSGFPEWLPADRIVENHIIAVVSHQFELHGFSNINTRAIEPLTQLARDGEIDKEIFAVNRLSAEGPERNPTGLHFDLTVPFGRYVLENAGKLAFPFKRYQVQPVWRGERPQDGRFREFIQADIDIVGDGELEEQAEVEVPLVMAAAFAALEPLGLPRVRILANNRRLLEGFARGVGLTDIPAVLRCLDKLDKIGPEKVAELLAEQAGADAEQQRKCLALARISGTDASFADEVRGLGVEHPMLEEGLQSLTRLVEAAAIRAPGVVVAQLKIARGLDYYTGTVYETELVGHEDLGSVASGGRYDNLVGIGERRYPGVGMSIGISRIMSRIVSRGVVAASRPVPTAVLVAVSDEEHRAAADAVAAALRGRDIPVDVSPTAAKFGKQIKFADRRGIPFVWFTDAESGHEVKDIRSGAQTAADPQTWSPPPEDSWPRVAQG